MKKGNNQKMKLLKIVEILKKETDVDNPMSTKKLIERLAENDVGVERKALYRDIETLNEFGYEIMTEKNISNYYYIVDRNFDTAEIRMLMDAVNGAKFLTEKKTQQLLDKLAFLSSSNMAEEMKKTTLCLDTPKHSNEKIFYSIDCINTGIMEGKQIQFKYFDYTTRNKIQYRKMGEKYVFNPISMVICDCNYYVVGFHDKYKNLCCYRIDRMEEVEVTEKNMLRLIPPLNLEKFNKKVFQMFMGKEQSVILWAENSLVGAIVDKFGENVKMYDMGNGGFEVKVKVELSPTFYSWCFTFSDKIRIMSPDEAIFGMKKQVEEVFAMYEQKGE